MDAPTDEQLLAGYLANRGDEFAKLVHRHSKELFQFVYRFTNNAASAEDVVQDTFFQVHQALETFDRDRRFKPWLFTIGANKARDYLRRRSRRSEVPLDAKVATDGEGESTFGDMLAGEEIELSFAIESEEVRDLVESVMQQMPDPLREALILAYFHRFPYKVMADVLDIPLGTVKSRLHAAVNQFATLYKAAAEGQAT